MEEMDKLFGGNAGQADLRRIQEIRARLGMSGDLEVTEDELKDGNKT